MTRVGETKYVVRRRPCGCLVSTKPAKDQAAAVAGATHAHPDGTVSTVLPLRVAATVPEFCAEHKSRSEWPTERPGAMFARKGAM